MRNTIPCLKTRLTLFSSDDVPCRSSRFQPGAASSELMRRRQPGWLFCVKFPIGSKLKGHLVFSRPTFGHRVRTISIRNGLEVELAVCQAAGQDTDPLEVSCTRALFTPRDLHVFGWRMVVPILFISLTEPFERRRFLCWGKSDLYCLFNLRQGRLYKLYTCRWLREV